MPLESRISKSIMTAIQNTYPACVVRKRHVSMGTTGDPDIYGILPGGHHFEIEVKQRGKRPTELQLRRLAEWARAGAITGVAHDAIEALEILFAGEKNKEQHV